MALVKIDSIDLIVYDLIGMDIQKFVLRPNAEGPAIAECRLKI